jgi:hypothetical protein
VRHNPLVLIERFIAGAFHACLAGKSDKVGKSTNVRFQPQPKNKKQSWNVNDNKRFSFLNRPIAGMYMKTLILPY